MKRNDLNIVRTHMDNVDDGSNGFVTILRMLVQVGECCQRTLRWAGRGAHAVVQPRNAWQTRPCSREACDGVCAAERGGLGPQHEQSSVEVAAPQHQAHEVRCSALLGPLAWMECVRTRAVGSTNAFILQEYRMGIEQAHGTAALARQVDRPIYRRPRARPLPDSRRAARRDHHRVCRADASDQGQVPLPYRAVCQSVPASGHREQATGQ
jgi:hypothetical protein